MITDPIADMLTRIRNAYMVKKPEVVLPMSKIKYNIAKILEKDGWIKSVEILEVPSKKNSSLMFNDLKIILKYDDKGLPSISSIKRISKPGRRVYVSKDELPRVLNGLGTAIISTSLGIMTNREARKKSVGGEIICEIY